MNGEAMNSPSSNWPNLLLFALLRRSCIALVFNCRCRAVVVIQEVQRSALVVSPVLITFGKSELLSLGFDDAFAVRFG